MSCLFTSGCQSIGTSALASVSPINIQDRFPLGLTGLISLLSKVLAKVFSSTTVEKHQFFGAQLSLWSKSHIDTWLLKKPWLWLYGIYLYELYLAMYTNHCFGIVLGNLIHFFTNEVELGNVIRRHKVVFNGSGGQMSSVFVLRQVFECVLFLCVSINVLSYKSHTL